MRMATNSNYHVSDNLSPKEYEELYYPSKLEEGNQYCDFLTKELSKYGIQLQMYTSKMYQIKHGESANGTEVKYDSGSSKPPYNLYIEVAEKSNPRNDMFVKSGIYRNDNTILWAQGNYDTCYIFTKKELPILVERCREVNKPTSIGRLLPKHIADSRCELKIRFKDMNLSEFEKHKDIFFNKFWPKPQPRKELSLDKWGI